MKFICRMWESSAGEMENGDSASGQESELKI